MKRWRLSWPRTLRTEVSLGVHPTLTAASRWHHMLFAVFIEVLCGSPTYTNQYTDPPETTVNDEQPHMREFSLDTRVLQQPRTRINQPARTQNLVVREHRVGSSPTSGTHNLLQNGIKSEQREEAQRERRAYGMPPRVRSSSRTSVAATRSRPKPASEQISTGPSEGSSGSRPWVPRTHEGSKGTTSMR